MKKLSYNIYRNIGDQEYFAIADKLLVIELQMAQLLADDGWSLSSNLYERDGLGADFIKKEAIFYGNLGILFEDRPEMATFRFYITKSFDENNRRYFLRHDVFENKEFNYFENNIQTFVNQALQSYKSWSKEDIVKLGIQIAWQ